MKPRRGSAVVACELGAAVGIAAVLVRAHTGSIAWMLSGITSGYVVLKLALRLAPGLVPNRRARRVGQALIGLSMGFSLDPALLAKVMPEAPLLLVLVAFMIATGVAVGVAYSVAGRVDLISALFSTVPGGASIMASVAAEQDRDTSLVAIVQASRIVLVVITIPLVVGAFERGSGGPGAPPPPDPLSLHTYTEGVDAWTLAVLAVLLGVVYAFVQLLNRLRLPVAPLFGSLAVGLVASMLVLGSGRPVGRAFAPPEIVHVLGQALLGLTIGEYLAKYGGIGRRALAFGLGSVAATIAIGLLVAFAAYELTSWSALTCLLVTAPGGAPEMLAIASAFGGDFEVVTVGQLFRQLSVNGLLPFWVLLFARLERAALARRAGRVAAKS